MQWERKLVFQQKQCQALVFAISPKPLTEDAWLMQCIYGICPSHADPIAHASVMQVPSGGKGSILWL